MLSAKRHVNIAKVLQRFVICVATVQLGYLNVPF